MNELEGSQADAVQRRYWRRNQRLIAGLLAIWALVSLGFSILFAEAIEGFRIGQLPAGFWWAQQGSMGVFVLLIFFYAWRMDHLDRECAATDETSCAPGAPPEEADT